MSRSEQAPSTSWFYRVDDRAVGPVMSSRLRQLARQGRLTADDLVRMGRNGDWVPAGTIEWLAAKPPPKTNDDPEPKQAAPQPQQASVADDLRTSAAYFLRNVYYSITHLVVASLWVVRHVLGVIALIAIMVILFNMGRDLGLYDWSQPVDVLGTVQSLGAEVKQKREAKATEAEWDELTQRGNAALEPVVQRLAKDAGSHNRVAQMLLWAARDCLPEMFADARTEPSMAEGRYDEYMANVAALEKNQPIYGGNLGGRINRETGTFPGMPDIVGRTSWTTILLVVLMIAADIAIVLWLVRAWRRRRA